ncbi:unnamed protein product [Onchocerca ochengi]|uniref:Bromo domain-containing protein n=1 Tax=Onchocerca ochengi TaxID=42157 RepID=A0A182EYG8_ONCOC|nr:unnamed protein product [Onchocerca ochengi]
MRAERHAARSEKARLRARQSSPATSDLLLFVQNERLRVAEGRQQEKKINVEQDSMHSNHVILIGLARKFKGEAKGMCWAAGKIKLPQLEEPPELLKALLGGYTDELKRFLTKIRKYNSCFQMTSFEAEIVKMEFMPTFKVKDKIYY